MPYCTCPACRDHWFNEYECLWNLSEFIESLDDEEDFLIFLLDDETEQEISECL